MDDTKTWVVFRVYERKGYFPDVVALFPLLVEKDVRGHWYCTSYEHVGQHGTADYNYVISISRPALPEEQGALHYELAGLGYHLDVHQRAPSWRKIDEARMFHMKQLEGSGDVASD